MGWKFYCDGKPNDKFKCCHDCDWITAYVSTWCSNAEVKAGGYNIFGNAKDCKFWKPMERWDNKNWWERFCIRLNPRHVVRSPVKNIENNRVVTVVSHEQS